MTSIHLLFKAIEATFYDRIVPALERKKLRYDRRIDLCLQPKLLPEWEMSYLSYLGVVYVIKAKRHEYDDYLFFDAHMQLVISSDNAE